MEGSLQNSLTHSEADDDTENEKSRDSQDAVIPFLKRARSTSSLVHFEVFPKLNLFRVLDDDLVLAVLEQLEFEEELMIVAQTCRRFHKLCHKNKDLKRPLVTYWRMTDSTTSAIDSTLDSDAVFDIEERSESQVVKLQFGRVSGENSDEIESNWKCLSLVFSQLRFLSVGSMIVSPSLEWLRNGSQRHLNESSEGQYRAPIIDSTGFDEVGEYDEIECTSKLFFDGCMFPLEEVKELSPERIKKCVTFSGFEFYNLRTLQLYLGSHTNVEVLKPDGNAFPNLSEIVIEASSDCPLIEFSDSSIRNSLKQLTMKGCKQLSKLELRSVSLKYLFLDWNALWHLFISNQCRNSDQILIDDSTRNSLSHLTVQSVDLDSAQKFNELCEFFRVFSNLSKLKLGICKIRISTITNSKRINSSSPNTSESHPARIPTLIFANSTLEQIDLYHNRISTTHSSTHKESAHRFLDFGADLVLRMPRLRRVIIWDFHRLLRLLIQQCSSSIIMNLHACEHLKFVYLPDSTSIQKCTITSTSQVRLFTFAQKPEQQQQEEN